MRKLNYDILETADAIPEAASTIESFRAIGYTLGTAVADIIDNSITAGARNVWIMRNWDGSDSSICIRDDGHGMDSAEAIRAMKPGSSNPLLERSAEDLGRFGLGLKTASFSQCRRTTLYSRRKGCDETFWTWDLDYVGQCGQWKLLRWMPEEYAGDLNELESGTMVIWTALDRIIPADTKAEDEDARQKFIEQLSKVRDHIAMTFHRFLEDGDIRIWWGETEIEPWDPFCRAEDKTQWRSVDTIPFRKTIVDVRGYILPHRNDFSSEDAYLKSQGINGAQGQQGFYVYRAKRLLLAGDWLGLFKKDEHMNLARIMIDIPNSLDSEWQIDIKKSTAIPPMSCREFIRGYARDVRNIAVEVYRHRGRIIRYRAGKKFQAMWDEKKTGNTISFVINRRHVFVQYLKELAKTKPGKAIDMLMNFIEESVPTKSIYIREAESGDALTPEVSATLINNLREVAMGIYNQRRSDGTPADIIKEDMKLQAPFNEYEYIIDELHD